MNEGDKIPEFCLKDKNKKEWCTRDFEGKWLIIYFYPKDNTSGCTLEALDFTKRINEFHSLNAEVIGISPDTCESHARFIEKHGLKVLLLSDPQHEIIERFGVWKLKKRYGREYHGVERSTFLVKPDGTIARVWRKVRVKGHVDEVLSTLEALVRSSSG